MNLGYQCPNCRTFGTFRRFLFSLILLVLWFCRICFWFCLLAAGIWTVSIVLDGTNVSDFANQQSAEIESLHTHTHYEPVLQRLSNLGCKEFSWSTLSSLKLFALPEIGRVALDLHGLAMLQEVVRPDVGTKADFTLFLSTENID